MSGNLYGLAWLVFAIYNTFNDPIIGHISDKQRAATNKNTIP
jgi:Na+/melibiose symporter-like transporter